MKLHGLPEKFKVSHLGNSVLIINTDYQDAVRYILDNLNKLTEKGSTQPACQPPKASLAPKVGSEAAGRYVKGRGRYSLVNINRNGIDNIIIKHYQRGGIITAWLLKDLFIGWGRSLKELRVTEMARGKGVPVPEILALIIRKAGWFFYRAEIILKEIPHTQDLNEVITGLSRLESYPAILWREKTDIIKTVAQAVRKLHEAGIFHRDLHLRNILIQTRLTTGHPVGDRGQEIPDNGKKAYPEPDTRFRAYIVDLDKASYYDSLSFKMRVSNLSRLNRSIEKWGLSTQVVSSTTGRRGMGVNTTDRLRLLKEYFGNEEITKDQKQVINTRCQRDLRLHRWWWSLRDFFLKLSR